MISVVIRPPSRTWEINVPKAKRDYRAEYDRQTASGTAKDVTRSQAHGHPKPNEATASSKRPLNPIEDQRLQLAFKVLRREKSLPAAAEAVRG